MNTFYDQDSIVDLTRFRRAAEGAQHFSPEELATMVERWKAAHANDLVDCLIPGTKTITKSACKAMRQRKGEDVADDLLAIHLSACEKCEHATPVKLAKVPISQRPDKAHNRRPVYQHGETSLKEACRRLNIKWERGRALCLAGELEYRKIEGTIATNWYVTEQSILRFAEKRRIEKAERMKG